jgi:DtxR family Mn-dependent transcriptional regulator
MTSVSVQDYLLAIYRLQAAQPPASTTAVAARLGVAPASVTSMVRKLDREGLVDHVPYHGVVLTEAGEREALRLLRRHRLWELFLSKVLGLPWDEVHLEADRLEHATSDRVADLLAEFLHEPKSDPHGQRIPTRSGSLTARATRLLSEVEVGGTARIVEVPDDDPALLRHLGDLGLVPGVALQVVDRSTADGHLIVCLGSREHLLDQGVADRVLMNGIDPEQEEMNA